MKLDAVVFLPQGFFLNVGWNVKVVNPSGIPTMDKQCYQKTDKIDCRNSTGKACLLSKIRIYKCVYQEYLTVANELRAYCRKNIKKDYYLLKSIPGVGGYLASVILAELGDIRRFNKASEFASYVGLIPMMRSSGGSENIFGITPRSRGHLRSYLIESAWVALRIDPEMQTYYRKHVGKNPKSIIVKIARKLTNRILSVIKTEKPYEINRNKI